MAINTHACVLKEEMLPSLGLLGGFSIEDFVLQKPGGSRTLLRPAQPVPASPPEPPSAAASPVDLMNG